MPATQLINCPVCGKTRISVIITPSHIEVKTSRGSGQSASVPVRVAEKYDVLSKCSECGASKKAIQDVLNGKIPPEEALKPKKKRCSFCKEPFDGPGKLCPLCAEWEE